MRRNLFLFIHWKVKVVFLKQISRNLMKPHQSCLMNKMDSLGAYYMAVIFEDVQEYMNIFVDMHGQADKPIVAISFEDVLRTKEIEQKQLTLMKDTCLSWFFLIREK
jgi:hypothetical protein